MRLKACPTCGWRLVRRGICPACRVALGLPPQSVVEEQAARDRHEQREAAHAALRRADPIPQPDRTVLADGILYDVVFDGRQSLLCERRTVTDGMRDLGVKRTKLRQHERAYRERNGVHVGFIAHRVDRRTA